MLEKISFIDNNIVETITFNYISGVSRKKYEAHFTEWRVFPYTVIVCAFETEYSCEIRDKGVFTIKGGDAVIVPRGTYHRMTFNHDGYLNFTHINYTIFNGIDLLSFFNIPYVIQYNKQNPLYKIIDNLYKNRYSDKPLFPIKKMLLFKELGFKLLNTICDQSTAKGEINFLLSRVTGMLPVLSYIQEKLNMDISRKDLAAILSLSETRFHYVFKEIVGISPMQYLRNIRFQKAHILIATTDIPISEIAASVGYTDTFTFSKQFKKYFGESPSILRHSIHKQSPFYLKLS